MKTLTSRWGMILSIVPLIVSILACSTGIPFLAPPTATPTATITNTPLPTFTPTKVPPPLTIYGCLYSDACPSSTLIRRYFDENETLYNNTQYYVDISYGDEVRFFYGWCTIDRPTLDENRSHMEYVFMIDGVSYLDRIDQGYTSMPNDSDPTLTYPCYSIGGVLSGWKVGESHQIVIGAKFLADIYDGWTTSAAGDYLMMYQITPRDIPTQVPPTATPKVTATSTRRPTSTPAPQVYDTAVPPVYDTAVPPVYDTPVPACDATGSVSIDNGTDGTVTIYLSGPANYTFYLGQGGNTVNVCPGSYSYTAYGCGGASDSGTVSDGDSISFSCVSP